MDCMAPAGGHIVSLTWRGASCRVQLHSAAVLQGLIFEAHPFEGRCGQCVPIPWVCECLCQPVRAWWWVTCSMFQQVFCVPPTRALLTTPQHSCAAPPCPQALSTNGLQLLSTSRDAYPHDADHPMTSAMQQNAVLLPSHLPIKTCPRHPACELSLNSHCINDWRADTCTSIKGTLGDSITLLGEDLQDKDHSLT